MVVADPGRETTSALEWALSHGILENDEVILLHVEASAAVGFRRGSSSSSFSSFLRRPSTGTTEVEGRGIGGEYEFLATMKAMCQARQPTVRVNIETIEMEERDKATTILAEANRRKVDMIVIGQRRSSFIGSKLSGSMSMKGPDLAEFLIEQSKCLCIAVQKKHSAGYVLNTKTHKNFWLLA
ncbi:Universal stress protein family [Carex littledalei]|uniref:Universal stress protein family n=1 Tax=Carex littledalei TaxID=544730 RepID=A0A833VLV3_9POAL|nr:Universal stress protein family [Carex littledalei]